MYIKGPKGHDLAFGKHVALFCVVSTPPCTYVYTFCTEIYINFLLQEAQGEEEDAEIIVKIFVQFHKASGIQISSLFTSYLVLTEF